MGYALERHGSPGAPAAQYVIGAILSVIVFFFLSLDFFFLIKRNQIYFTLTSIAGIGGYLSSLTLALVFEPEMISVGTQLRAVIFFGLPMISVFLHHFVYLNTKLP